MGIDQWIRLLEIVVLLIQALIWPLFALFTLLYIGAPLKNYFNNLSKDNNVREVSAEAGLTGVKLSVKREVEVATNLALAATSANTFIEKMNTTEHPTEVQPQEVIRIASEAAKPEVVQRIAGTRALWVNDNPANHYYERNALEALGIQITLSLTTEDALDKVQQNNYDIIISDMGRQPPDPNAPYEKYAGYTLLEELQKRNIGTPFIIYSSSNLQKHKDETHRRGGFGSTNNPQELFQLVLSAIVNG